MTQRSTLCIAAAFAVAFASPPAHSQAQRADSIGVPLMASDTAVITPGAQYDAGWLHRFLLGADYRELWTTPIPVPVLDLNAFAGGLKPEERGGGMQTRSLRFEGGNGREYVFRTLDKDHSRALPPALRETLVERIFQDQVATLHPAGALIVSRLLDATDIRHVDPQLVVLPDDPRLGEFRAEFARQLGTLEERPGKGFDESPQAAGATQVISTERLFERMAESPRTRVDARLYLKARLFDVFVGDRDRHRDQWRWARFGPEDSVSWEPIPRDRDMAFARNDGLMLSIARGQHPQLVTFKKDYPSMLGLNWNAREIDRRILPALNREVWDSVARGLQRALTDSAIRSAVSVMPPPFLAKNADELTAELMARRDRLHEAAAEFYELHAREVDFQGTNQRDLAEVTHHADGSMEVSLSALEETSVDSAIYLQRRFHPHDTKEVRVYLHQGDDRVIVRGDRASQIELRVIGGDGDDELIDSVRTSGKDIRFYDASGENRVSPGASVDVDTRAYTPPATERPQDPPRDWGHEWRPASWTSYAPEIGLFVGTGRTLFRYGFREDPYASRTTFQIGYALEAGKARAQMATELRRSNSRSYATLLARASGIEVIRFYGLGNETTAEQADRFFRVNHSQYLLVPSYVMPLSRRGWLSLGGVAQYSSTEDEEGTLLGLAGPYGAGTFGQIGARAEVDLDGRDRPIASTRGVHLTVGGTLYPAVWDVENTFGELHGTAAAYFTGAMRIQPTLALRAGARRVWGTFPFHESAFLGGGSTVRGWGEQRFAGHSAVYGNAELRLFLT
ncbi:MAG TPA: BamA/TamA family outer membrane protein, partial [Gemmatimonadaceae bacterium]|nr:BamA/TamA family outer membrane protein [Gemmatimonadaceae bacterium]